MPGGVKLGLFMLSNPMLELPSKLPIMPTAIGIIILIIKVLILFKNHHLVKNMILSNKIFFLF